MVTIQGVRVTSVSLNRDADGVVKMTGSYSLVSSSDKVIAKQDFNGYSSDLKVEATGETVILLDNLMKAIKSNIETQLGLVEE